MLGTLKGCHVAILILMEDSQRQWCIKNKKPFQVKVAILILMEDSQRHQFTVLIQEHSATESQSLF